MGIALTVTASLCIVANICTMAMLEFNAEGLGYWSGALYLSTGIVSICAGRGKGATCTATASLVLGIIGCLASLVHIFAASIMATVEPVVEAFEELLTDSETEYDTHLHYGLMIFIAVLGVAAFVLCLAISIMYCTNCSKPDPVPQIVHVSGPMTGLGVQQFQHGCYSGSVVMPPLYYPAGHQQPGGPPLPSYNDERVGVSDKDALI
jgi:hypothetical protein